MRGRPESWLRGESAFRLTVLASREILPSTLMSRRESELLLPSYHTKGVRKDVLALIELPIRVRPDLRPRASDSHSGELRR